MQERASSWPTPVLDGCSSANFTFIATCTWIKLLTDETLLLDNRCPAVLHCQAFFTLRLCARSQQPEPQTALVPSHIDFTRSQAGLYSLSDWPCRHVHTYVHTQTGTHACMQVQVDIMTPWGSLRLAPIDCHLLPTLKANLYV